MNKTLHIKILILPILAILSIWAYTVYNHNIFEEWDGVMHYYSGRHLLETGVYSGWASHFWPPLQSLLLSLGDPLLIGKTIAVFSGLAVLIAANSILSHFNVNQNWRLLTLTALASLPFFTIAYSVVENHALESAFFLLSVSSYLKFKSSSSELYLIVCSVLCACAGLVRYTSYTLALIIGIFLLLFSTRKMRHFIIFSIVFIIVSSFWWAPNYLMNGSPLATWQYLNMGSHLATMNSSEWWWSGQNSYDGMVSLIKAYPYEYIKNIASNITISIALIFSSLSALQVKLSIIPFLVFLKLVHLQRKSLINNDILFIGVSIVTYILLCSTAFVFFDVLLPVILLSLLLTFLFISRNTYKPFQVQVIIIAFILANIAVSIVRVDGYLKNQRTNDQLYDYNIVSNIIKNDSENIRSTVMSIHPAYGYYTEKDWIMTPLGAVNDLCDVLKYNVSNKVFNYAPKSNFNLNKESLTIDYIVITKGLAKRWPFVTKDLEINNKDKCSESLNELYRSPGVVLLKRN
nr:hypothetical protein [uncultured Glaciecola sp.]